MNLTFRFTIDPGPSLNPLLIGAQCELEEVEVYPPPESLNPLLIGAQCERASNAGLDILGWSQSPFDRGSV